MGPGSRRGRNPLPCGERAGRPGQSGKGHPEALDLPGGSGWGVAGAVVQAAGSGVPGGSSRHSKASRQPRLPAPCPRSRPAVPQRGFASVLCRWNRALGKSRSRGPGSVCVSFFQPREARGGGVVLQGGPAVPSEGWAWGRGGTASSGACGPRRPFLGLPPELREGGAFVPLHRSGIRGPRIGMPRSPHECVGGRKLSCPPWRWVWSCSSEGD